VGPELHYISGGNDLGSEPVRDETEMYLLDHAIKIIFRYLEYAEVYNYYKNILEERLKGV
jgi:hypothetical protein